MEIGQWLTRGTVWLALALYVASQFILSKTDTEKYIKLARILNTFGCAIFLAHVACAFQFHHHWSHSAAYADTAKQTKAYFGLNWGGGLYFNYLFAGLWVSQVIWTWSGGANNAAKTGVFTLVSRAFFMLIIFNGAVVFAHGPIRWFGATLCLVLIHTWWPRKEMIRQHQ